MRFDTGRLMECTASPRREVWPTAVQAAAAAQAIEARRLIEEVREALDRDVAAAHLSVVKLAKVLQDTTRSTPQGGCAPGGLAPWQLRRVCDHVAAHLSEALPIRELAALVRLSPSHFTRAFGASMGSSPHAYIVGERLEYAKRMLLETDDAICQIALACGMTDQAHLTKLFTRYEGLSPAAWRRLHSEVYVGAHAA